MSLVGRPAPDFTAKAVSCNQVTDLTLSSLRGKKVVFFFYPLDFTFVCPTELVAFQARLDEFKERKTEVVGCSVDSHFSHLAWVNTPRNKGGIEGVQYPLVSDLTKTISQDYGVLVPGEGIAYRGLFLIDEEGIVRHQLINDLPLGRSVDETLRMVDALSFFQKNGEVCPANWQNGQQGMQTTTESVAMHLSKDELATT